jgi:beta-galactosidase GanA
MKTYYFLSVCFLSLLYPLSKAQHKEEAGTSVPCLRQQGTATQLIVDGHPYLILGGELGNSTASDPALLGKIWPVLQSMHLNTLLAPVYWEMAEPGEGEFDFSLVDSLIAGARTHNMRLVLLWFGTWKNSMSCYVPVWIKKDFTRFPRARDNKNTSLEMLTAFSEENLQADLRAFTSLMRHIRDTDDRHTVIMIQVENEVGMIPVACDFCKSATEAFLKQVPGDLMQYLSQNRENLQSGIRERWAISNYRTEGSWEDIFGISSATEEIFMAWHYAAYVNRIAAAGKLEYPLPMYVNAALNRPQAKPGEYPSGGPLPHLMDIWKAGAPSIDFLAPDIYTPYFAEWCIKYHQNGNLLFVPEIMRGANNAANVFYALGKHDAIGFSPFSIESVPDPLANRLTTAYCQLEELTPLILENQGKGTMTGILLDRKNPVQTITMNDYRLTFSYEPDDRYAYKGNLSDSTFRTGGIVFTVAPDEFIVAGSGLIVTFAPAMQDTELAGIGSIDECHYENGQWIPVMRLNGDQSHQGRHMRLPNDRFSVQRVKLYRYK